jgi:signal peptidase I
MSKWKSQWAGLFWTVLLILFIRGFIVEPFKIPSGSMFPTLMIGDNLFVGKSSYDLGIPFTNIKFLKVGEPKRGDVMVFRYPNNESDPSREGLYYIKRLIGLPGDRIRVSGGIPYFDSVAVQQRPVTEAEVRERMPAYTIPPGNRVYMEQLPGMDGEHLIQRDERELLRLPRVIAELQANTGQSCIEVGTLALARLGDFLSDPILSNEICSFTVPADSYFVMGDNRDNSLDGRAWGFVERKLLMGRALFVWLSILQDSSLPDEGGPLLRWLRLGLPIK